MAQSILRVTVNGIDYAGWKTVEVFRSMQEITGDFTLQMVDLKRGQALPLIKTGDDCLITIQNEPKDEPFLIMTGFVDSVTSSFNKGGVKFTISGRDKTSDLVDCSVTEASEWKNLKFEDFVQDIIKPFNLKVVLDSEVETGDEIETINYDQGGKIYELIAKHAQLKQLIVYPEPDGVILITRAKIKGDVIDTAFIEGVNILSATAKADWSQVYQQYRVKGSRQSTGDDSDEKAATQIEAIITDARVTRFRPLIIIPDTEGKTVSALARAQWEATVRMGNAENYTVVIQGWRPVFNQLAYIELPTFAFKGNMIIESFRLIADEEGKRTEFAFFHPRAFTPLAELNIVKDEQDSKLIEEINENLANQLANQKNL